MDRNTNNIPRYPVQTLEKALDIIEFLSTNDSRSPVGISAISRELDLSKSTVHRILDTLVAYGWVEQCSSTRGYRLGWKLFEIGNAVPVQHSVYNLDQNSLESLCDEFNEGVNLGIRDGKKVVIIARVEPHTRFRVNFQIGNREPLHATSLGKILLSELSDQEVIDLLGTGDYERFTPNTITTFHELKTELDRIRQQGFAFDDEELSQGLVCIAMPVRDYENKIIAAVSVSGPSFRMNFTKLANIRNRLEQVTKELSAYMGAKC